MRTLSKSAVVVALLLAATAACGGEPEPGTATGPQLFQSNCSQCHADGTGSALAPTLHGKKSGWTRETLVTYLQDPVGYAAKDPRLKAQGAKYSLPMPSYKTLARGDLEKLADHVLAMP
jgi:mono/diheme cytochrome c family protein